MLKTSIASDHVSSILKRFHLASIVLGYEAAESDRNNHRNRADLRLGCCRQVDGRSSRHPIQLVLILMLVRVPGIRYSRQERLDC